MLEKAAGLTVEELVIDLEDAVPAAAKADACERLLPMLGRLANGGASLAVRVNPPRSPWCHRELELLAGAGPELDSVIVPKVEDIGDLAFVERLLDGAEAAAGRARPLRVQALIESAAGLARTDAIASCGERLDALVLGYADLAVSLGRSDDAASDCDRWRHPQEQILVAARTHGLQAIDGPHFKLDDDDGLRAWSQRTAEAGFDGKWALHPCQIDVIRAAFTPSARTVERARAVLAALARAEAGGTGAVALDGQMVDEAMARAARRVLARADEELEA